MSSPKITFRVPAAEAWIGPDEHCSELAQSFLAKVFCRRDGQESCTCPSCSSIRHLEHPNMVWINPKKRYTTDDIAIIFSRCALALDEDEQFYFVLQKAHNLGTTCSNRLLKVLEEPPAGYKFLLLSNNVDALLPTVTSRCLIKPFNVEGQLDKTHPIAAFFYERRFDEPIAFDQTLRTVKPSDQESTLLLSEMYAYFACKVKESEKKEAIHARTALAAITRAMLEPPQSGSSQLFWKNLFLVFCHLKA